PLFLVVFLLGGVRDYRAMIQTLCLSLATAAIFSIWSVKRYLRPRFDPACFRMIFGYAAMAALNLLTMACVIAPGRIILHHVFGPHEVGIFSAYFTATAQISLALLYMVSSVLLPLASSPLGQKEAWQSFRSVLAPLSAAAFCLFALGALLALALFGRSYPLRPGWLLLFTLSATLILLHGIASTLFMARDFSGLRISVTGNLIAGLANLGLGLALIPRWGIWGAGTALMAAYALGLAYYGKISSVPTSAASMRSETQAIPEPMGPTSPL
ncbi:MAG: hypothetical protein PHF00_13765, partial [Elusimicrobia bacterium]|nr:hypothetical protein [Elusimicrobiota bacterium]